MREKIFAPRQVLAAAVIGGPLGGLYALTRNLMARDNVSLVVACVFLGWIPVLIYFAAAPYMPLWASLGLLPVFTVSAYLASNNKRTEKAVVQAGKKYEYFDYRDVAVMSCKMLAATIALELLWIRILADFR